MYSGWFADIPSTRKAVLVFLRERYDSGTGKRVFPEEALAGLVGRTTRQAVDGPMKGFRDAEGNLLEFLKHPRNVDDEVVALGWQVLCANPYASVSSMAVQANASASGAKPLNESNVREALSQIGGYNGWREMLTGLENGTAPDKERKIQCGREIPGHCSENR